LQEAYCQGTFMRRRETQQIVRRASEVTKDFDVLVKLLWVRGRMAASSSVALKHLTALGIIQVAPRDLPGVKPNFASPHGHGISLD
jgi:hypothetical protein